MCFSAVKKDGCAGCPGKSPRCAMRRAFFYLKPPRTSTAADTAASSSSTSLARTTRPRRDCCLKERERGEEKKELKIVNERAPMYFLNGRRREKNIEEINPLGMKRSVRERASTPRTTYRVRVRARRSIDDTRMFRSAPWSQPWIGERGR